MKNIIKENKNLFLGMFAIITLIVTFSFSQIDKTIVTTAKEISNKKIEWGIKRGDDHKQPDLGSSNKRIIDDMNRNSNGRQRF